MVAMMYVHLHVLSFQRLIDLNHKELTDMENFKCYISDLSPLFSFSFSPAPWTDIKLANSKSKMLDSNLDKFHGTHQKVGRLKFFVLLLHKILNLYLISKFRFMNLTLILNYVFH